MVKSMVKKKRESSRRALATTVISTGVIVFEEESITLLKIRMGVANSLMMTSMASILKMAESIGMRQLLWLIEATANSPTNPSTSWTLVVSWQSS